MYKHLAESIKENDHKQFMTKTEIEKLNSYENTFREKTDTYTKQELQDFINEFGVVTDRFQGSELLISNSKETYTSSVEIYGNTVQNSSKLSDIKSVGDRLPDGRYKIPIVCTGKNLFDKSKVENVYIEAGTGAIKDTDSGLNRSTGWIKCLPNTTYIVSGSERNRWLLRNSAGKVSYIGSDIGDQTPTVTTLDDTVELKCYVVHRNVLLLDKIQIEVGDTPTEYEPYCEYKCDIILDEPLDKLGNFSDRIFNNDGVWTVEKYICNEFISGTNNWARHGVVIDGQMPCYKCELPLAKPADDVSLRRIDSCISDRYRTVQSFTDINSEDIFIDRYSILFISIKPSSLESDNIDEFKKYITKNPMNLKYVLDSPRLIPLPENQQIKLKSFEGITHIFFDCELSGKVICDLPRSKKSILDSVSEEVKVLNKEMELIENMENGTKTTLSTNSNLVMLDNTSNSYIDNIRIEGETLVNISRKYYSFQTSGVNDGKYTTTINDRGVRVTITEAHTSWSYFTSSKIPITMKPNTTYTIFIGRHKNIPDLIIRTGNSDMIGSTLCALPKTETTNGKYLITTNSNIETLINTRYNDTFLYHWVPGTVGDYILEDVMIIEGDHRDKPLSYFEGLKSVGDTVGSISLTTSNENLLDINKLFNNTGPHRNCTSSVNGNTVIITNRETNSDSYTNTGVVTVGKIPNDQRKFAIPVEEGKTYVYSRYVQITELFESGINRSSEYVTFVDENYNFLSIIPIELENTYWDNNDTEVTTEKTYRKNIFTAPKGAKYMLFRVGIRAKAVCEYSDMQIREDINHSDSYLPHKSDTKHLLYKNSLTEWEKPVLRSTPCGINDIIDKQSDGKYYLISRCEEIILNGSENWEIHGNISVSNRTTVVLPFKGVRNQCSVFTTNLQCDKLRPTYRDNVPNLPNSIAFHSNKYVNSTTYNAWISLTIDNRLLQSTDVTGVKNWLASNTPTIVLPRLGKDVEYECSPIDLQTYSGNTYMYLNIGAIKPKIETRLSSDIGNTLQLMNEKISTLESQVIDNYVFDSILLLQSIYSSDVAKLQLDIATTNNLEACNNDYSNDLYILLKEVILFGKGSIDDLYLETIIDFYTMVGVISFDTADELFTLLYDYMA